MKKSVLVLVTATMLIGTHVYAENGDLIVNGKLGVGTISPGLTLLDVRYKDGNTNLYRASDTTGLYRWRIDQLFNMVMTNSAGLDTMAIYNNGNVGIGTTSLGAYKLWVAGSLRSDGIGSGTSWSFGGNGDFAIDAPGIAGGRLIVKDGNGNVGIGTTNPADKLTVWGGSGTQYFRAGASSSWGMGITDPAWTNTLQFSNSGPVAKIWHNAGSPIVFQTENGGNVGIGTTDPKDRFDINGGALRWGYAPEPITYYARTFFTPVGNGDANQTTLKFEVKSYPNSVASTPLTLTGAGNVGIGTASPKTTLHIMDSTKYPTIRLGDPINSNGLDIWASTLGGYLQASWSSIPTYLFLNPSGGNVGIGTASQSYKFYVAGTSYSTGGWFSSDLNFKKNLQPIGDSLSNVLKMQGHSYEWKTEEYKDKGFPEGRHYGVIAQEIEKILPEVVKESSDGTKAVAYGEIIPVLIEAIKEQQKRIDLLEKKLDGIGK